MHKVKYLGTKSYLFTYVGVKYEILFGHTINRIIVINVTPLSVDFDIDRFCIKDRHNFNTLYAIYPIKWIV